jgi:predicted O-linked N-acetylglucosamine transferase (SPINDLY family)
MPWFDFVVADKYVITDASQKYFTENNYLDLVEKKFGYQQRKNIEEMTKIKLKRKLLGD